MPAKEMQDKYFHFFFEGGGGGGGEGKLLKIRGVMGGDLVVWHNAGLLGEAL